MIELRIPESEKMCEIQSQFYVRVKRKHITQGSEEILKIARQSVALIGSSCGPTALALRESLEEQCDSGNNSIDVEVYVSPVHTIVYFSRNQDEEVKFELQHSQSLKDWILYCDRHANDSDNIEERTLYIDFDNRMMS